MLRHSFATHLLDKEIDVTFIQKLLGHNDIKTTLKYLHVTKKDLLHTISPLADAENLMGCICETQLVTICTSQKGFNLLIMRRNIF